jgi:hypothetical protein
MTGASRPGGGGKKHAAAKSARDAAANLQKGDGVRRFGLHGDLGPELRRIWHIADDARPRRVSAIVFLRLEAVLGRTNQPKLDPVVRTAYNMCPRSLAGNKGDRLAELPKPSTRTCDRWLKRFQEELLNSLAEPHVELDAEEIRRAERRFDRPPAIEESGARDSTPTHGASERGLDDFVRAFAVHSWCSPADRTDDPMTVGLGKRGFWLCAFDTPDRLAGYRAATGAPWPSEVVRRGRELVGAALVRRVPAGILVNPSSVRGAGTAESYALPPSVLTGLITIRR